MTRKEELKKRAVTIVDEFPVCFLTKLEEKEYDEYVFDMLLKVEREVWERVDRYYSNQVHYDMDDYPDKFVKWLRAQQQELGS